MARPAFHLQLVKNRAEIVAAVAEVQRTVRGLSFDEEPLPELNSEAIDFRVASECFAPVRRLSRADLRSMRLLQRTGPARSLLRGHRPPGRHVPERGL